MSWTSNEDKVFGCRSYLLDECSSLARSMTKLRPPVPSESLDAVSKVKLSDDTVQTYTSSMLERNCALEVNHIVELLTNRLSAHEKDNMESNNELEQKRVAVTVAMSALQDFFRAHDEAEAAKLRAAILAGERNPATAAVSTPSRLRQLLAQVDPFTVGCTFEQMSKLSSQWDRWTGNVPHAPDMEGFVKAPAEKITYVAEAIKIPFKPSVWVRNAQKHKPVHSDNAASRADSPHDGAPAAMSSGADTQHHRATSAASGTGVGAAAARAKQEVLGEVRFTLHPESAYWSSLALTESIMASPCYQHLSSEKFQALEHFAAARDFADHEVILQQHQRFFTIYFLRHGAVKVFQPDETNPGGPPELVKILQSGDFFGFECLATDLTLSPSRFTYAAHGPRVQCFAIPVEYFSDLLLKEQSHKAEAMKVSIGLETAPMLGSSGRITDADPAQVNLDMYALSQQEVRDATLRLSQAGSSVNTFAKLQQGGLLRLDRLLNPEFTFPEVVDEFLNTSKEVMNVDRACLYVIDRKADTMRFYGLPSVVRQVSISGAQGMSSLAAPSISVGEGVVSALNGVVAHVVLHAAELCIANYGTSEYYDPAVEKRTCMGRKIKNLLLTPVFDRAGRVIAVLQYTNPKTREGLFTHEDVLIASCIASKAALIDLKSTLTSPGIPIHQISDTLTFHLDRLVMDKTNRHLRGTVKFYLGNQQYGPTFTTPTVATYPIMGDLRRCDFKHDITIAPGNIGGLPPSARVIFSFESTNKHPIVWAGLYLFDYLRMLRQGEVNLQMWDGAVPSDIASVPSLLEAFGYSHGATDLTVKNPTPSKILQGSGAVLTVHLPMQAGPVVHTTPGVVKYALTMGLHNPLAINPLPADFRVSPVPLPAGTVVDWYARQMTPSETTIFQALTKIVDVIDQSDLDSETCRLLWRMRNALCMECPWAMLWFMLSCEWSHPVKVEETYRLLYSWASLHPLDVMPLLDDRFRDRKVRAFAANFLDRLSEPDFQDALPQLVYMLRYDQHADSALARLLLRRALCTPETTGKLLLWHLHDAFVTDPIVGANCHRLAQVYLRALPDLLRAHQGHGLYALTRLDSIYRGIVAADQSSLRSGQSPDPALKVQALLAELNHNPWPSEFATPAPVSAAQHTTGVVECNKLPTMPHTFVFALKYQHQPLTRFVHSLAIPAKVEMFYHAMLRAVNLAWSREDMKLSALCYDAFVVGGTGIVQNIVTNGKPLVSLAGRVALAQSGGASGVDPSGRSTSPVFKGSIRGAAIPNSLLLDHLRSSVGSEGRSERGTPPPGRDDGTILFDLLNTTVRNLAAFAVVNQVLGLKDASVFNTIITTEGRVFVQNPGNVLGVDAATAAGSADAKSAKAKSASGRLEPIFFPRFFDHLLTAGETPRDRDFAMAMSAALLALRKNAPFLLWSLKNTAGELGFPASQLADCTELLKERLLLKMNDEAALTRMKEIVRYSASLEPSFHAPESHVAFVKPTSK